MAGDNVTLAGNGVGRFSNKNAGDYVIDVRHDVSNVGTAPVTPQLYMQLVHDGNKPVGDSFFNSSYTGPTLYTPQDKYQKMTFEKIEKAAVEDERTGKDTAMKGLHPVRADGGWFAISQHFFVSAFVPPANIARDIFTKKLSTNTYAIA